MTILFKIRSVVRKYLFQVVLILLVVILSKNQVKCELCTYASCGGEAHIMCIFPPQLDKTQPRCKNPESRAGMMSSYRRAVLDRHNQFRQAVAQGKVPGQPPAANMRKLRWSSELETIAQRYVNSCPPVSYYTCRNMKDGSEVGENAGTNWFSYKRHGDKAAYIREVVDDWFKEMKFMKPKYVKEIRAAGSDLNKVFRYAQMVWANSELLGCGYLQYNYEDENDQFLLLNCNYAQAAKLYTKGAQVYVEGEPCSKCPQGYHCSKRYPGLCTQEIDEDHDIPYALANPDNDPTDPNASPTGYPDRQELMDEDTPGWCRGRTVAASWSAVLLPVLAYFRNIL